MNEFKIMLESAGFILFDPFNLDQFCIDNNIVENNIMKTFIENETIGDMAIKKGKILPIYTIKEDDYKIIVSNDIKIKENQKFVYKNFPLEIINRKLVVADIFAIQNWEPDFYKNLKNNFPTQFIIDICNGNYSVDIIGFYKDNNNYGYNFVLNEVGKLPEIDISKDVDAYNFNIL